MGVILGGAATVLSVIIVHYDIGLLDAEPQGGVVASGAATVAEHIPYLPVGGGVAGGAATITDAIPFQPSGGATTVGATAPSAQAFTPPLPVGGATTVNATAANVFKTTVAPSGGGIAGGTAPVTALIAWHMPSGGVIAGGVALAYSVPFGSAPTTENPYADPFPGWSMNFDTKAPSRYLGLAANSMTQLGGVTYVANAGGIYSIDNTTDAGQPIRGGIVLPDSDYGDSHNKRIPWILVGLRSAVGMVAEIVTDNADQSYTQATPVDGRMRASRVKFGKGIEGRYVQLGLFNVGGAAWELESLEIPYSQLKRHGR
jgi:hypothetical protein